MYQAASKPAVLEQQTEKKTEESLLRIGELCHERRKEEQRKNYISRKKPGQTFWYDKL